MTFSGRVVHPAGDGVVYGTGSVERHLAGLVERSAMRRPFVVTTGSVVRAGLLDEVVGALGVAPAGVFAGSREHTPAPTVVEAAEQARASGADGLVSIGGSSVVDLTKGVALLLSGDVSLDDPRPLMDRPKLVHLAVPTTLSGAEFTSAAGITDPTSGHKRAYVHPSLAPRWVVLDPILTRATPPQLWAATGMKVLADAIEMRASTRASPLSDAVAGQALVLLGEHLVASTLDDADLDGRARCQFASAMVLSQLVGVGLGLVAALRHQLGGALGVAHGVASTIVLPHVVRWNAAAAPDALEATAAVLGAGGVEGLIGRLEALTDELGLPRRLADVGVRRADLADVARHVLADVAVRTNPRRVDDVDDVLAVLDAAF